MLRTARIEAKWERAPTIEEIRAKDQERLIARLRPDGDLSEDDLAVARVLLSGENAEAVAISADTTLERIPPEPSGEA